MAGCPFWREGGPAGSSDSVRSGCCPQAWRIGPRGGRGWEVREGRRKGAALQGGVKRGGHGQADAESHLELSRRDGFAVLGVVGRGDGAGFGQ